MKTTRLLFLISFTFCLNAFSQDVIPIWEGMERPYYKDNELKEYEADAYGTRVLYNITEPTLTIYPAKGENTGKAVIILPGGGYELEAIYHEGYEVASFLAEHGIAGVVLKYRLPKQESSDQPHLVPITDTRRALQLVREIANKYGIDKEKVGVIGFSAGSHLATCASVWRSEVDEENPNFSGLIYGVTNFKEDNIKWLENSLYYRNMTEDEKAQYDFQNLVTKDTPPAFLAHAYDDDVCHVSESTNYADKLFKHGVMVEMHLFPMGGHGFGMGREKDGTDQWPLLFVNWLKKNF